MTGFILYITKFVLIFNGFVLSIYHSTSCSWSLVGSKCLSGQNTILYLIYYPSFFLCRMLYVGVRWQVTCDKWQVTCDMWHVTCAICGFCLFGGNSLLPFQKSPPISLDKMLLFKMPFFWKGILSRNIKGHF